MTFKFDIINIQKKELQQQQAMSGRRLNITESFRAPASLQSFINNKMSLLDDSYRGTKVSDDNISIDSSMQFSTLGNRFKSRRPTSNQNL